MNSSSNFSGSQKQLFLPLCEGCGLAVALLGMTRATEFIWAVLARQVFKFLDKSEKQALPGIRCFYSQVPKLKKVGEQRQPMQMM